MKVNKFLIWLSIPLIFFNGILVDTIRAKKVTHLPVTIIAMFYCIIQFFVAFQYFIFIKKYPEHKSFFFSFAAFATIVLPLVNLSITSFDSLSIDVSDRLRGLIFNYSAISYVIIQICVLLYLVYLWLNKRNFPQQTSQSQPKNTE